MLHALAIVENAAVNVRVHVSSIQCAGLLWLQMEAVAGLRHIDRQVIPVTPPSLRLQLGKWLPLWGQWVECTSQGEGRE